MTLPKWAGLGVHVTALPNSAGLGVGQVTALPKFFGLGVCVIGLPKVCGSVIGLPLRKSPLRFKPRGMGDLSEDGWHRRTRTYNLRINSAGLYR